MTCTDICIYACVYIYIYRYHYYQPTIVILTCIPTSPNPWIEAQKRFSQVANAYEVKRMGIGSKVIGVSPPMHG